jgi:hypothetical protein
MYRIFGVAAWLLTRGAVLWLFFGPHAWVTGDIAYFDMSLRAVPDVGLDDTLVEYPLPGVVLVAVPWVMAEVAGLPGLYSEVVMGLALATDAAFTMLLGHFGGPWRRAAVASWILAVPLLGATVYARFDLVPGILAGTAVLLLARHPAVAAGAAAVATGLKAWPALLLPAIAAPRASRRPVVATVAVLGTLMVAATIVLAGWGRLFSPLTWQADRGLQIESVAATPAMLQWARAASSHQVVYSDFNAFEISGPGVGALMAAASVLTFVLLLGVAGLWLAAWRRGSRLTPEAVAWLSLAAVASFLVSSKVLSPQYLLWLLPMAAAALAAAGVRRGTGLWWWTGGLLVAAGLTQLVFPVLYGGLVEQTGTTTWAVLVLSMRNALLLALLVGALVGAARHVLRADGPDDAEEVGLVTARGSAGPREQHRVR